MAFNSEEKQIIEYNLKQGKSKDEIRQSIINYRLGIKKPKAEEPKESLVSKVVGGAQKIFDEGRQEIQQEVTRTGEQMAEVPDTAVGTFVEKPALLLRTLFRGAGTAVKTAGKLIAEPVVAGVSKTADMVSDIPEVQKFANNKFISNALDTVLGGMAQIGESYDTFKQNSPELARDLEAGTEILLTVLGEKPTQEILSRFTSRAKGLADETLGSVKEAGTKLTEGVSNLKNTATDFVSEKARPLTSRIQTNLAERRATKEAIQALPTPKAQDAARNGIDINDVKYIVDELPEDRTVFNQLLKTAREFEKNPRGTDPIELVGKPITERLKTLETQRKTVGAQLGEISKNLGDVTREELFPVVTQRLQAVPGLNGLKVSDKGILDFTDTVISSGLTSGDRNVIQEIFTDAIKEGTGSQKHRLRQELFEVLGGKKKSLENITDTQDKAFEAIRSALSDVLEAKNDQYKTVSNEYRKIIQPMQDLRRVMKDIPGATEDILDMQAGLLARRLTSTAPSNPKIRQILRDLDATGGTVESVEQLQDFYNIIGKYYNISPKTSFEGGIKSAIGSTNVVERIMKAVSGVAGETPAVRQKALEDLMEEIR